MSKQMKKPLVLLLISLILLSMIIPYQTDSARAFAEDDMNEEDELVEDGEKEGPVLRIQYDGGTAEELIAESFDPETETYSYDLSHYEITGDISWEPFSEEEIYLENGILSSSHPLDLITICGELNDEESSGMQFFAVNLEEEKSKVYKDSEFTSGTINVTGKSNRGSWIGDNMYPKFWKDKEGHDLWCVDPFCKIDYSRLHTIKDATDQIGQDKATRIALALEYIRQQTSWSNIDRAGVSQYYVWREMANTEMPNNSYSIKSLTYGGATGSRLDAIESYIEANKKDYIGTAYYYSTGSGSKAQPFMFFELSGNPYAVVVKEVSVRKEGLKPLVAADGVYKFSLTGTSGEGVYEAIVQIEKGKLTGTSKGVKVPPGTYRVVETECPNGIYLNSNPYELKVTKDNDGSNPAKITIANNADKWVYVEKTITAETLEKLRESKEEIKGKYSFKIYSPGGEYLWTVSCELTEDIIEKATSEKVSISTNMAPLVAGKGYTAEESQCPDGVIPFDGEVKFDVSWNNTSENPAKIPIENKVPEEEKGGIKMKKALSSDISEEDKEIWTSFGGNFSGIEYTVYGDEDCKEEIGVLKLGKNGNSINEIQVEPGTYYAKETKVNSFVLPNDRVIGPIEVTEGKTKTFKATDDIPFGYIQVRKKVKDTVDEALWLKENNYEGVAFEVKTSGGIRVGTISVPKENANTGLTDIIKVPSGGKYSITEVAVNGSLITDATPIMTETITRDHTSKKPYITTFENDIVTKSFRIAKSSMENSEIVESLPNVYSLKGARFVVKNANGSKKWELETDESGRTKNISGFPLGVYTAEEVEAPFGFKLDKTVHEIRLTEKSPKVTTFTSYDEPIFGEVALLLKKTSTPSDWNISVEDCEFLVRYFEINPRDVENLSQEELIRRLEGEEAMKSWVFKSDKYGRVLADKEHLLEQSREGATKDVQSDELYLSNEGKVLMPIGVYIIEEIFAGEGLVRNEEKHVALVNLDEKEEKATIAGFGFTMNNKAISITISAKKIDKISGQEVPAKYGSFKGATFDVISKSDDKKVATLILDEKGGAKIGGLKPDNYVIRETVAPKGYIKAEALELNGLVKEVNGTKEVYDYYLEIPEEPTRVRINKVIINEEGKEEPFPGCTLELYDERKNLIEKWVTTEEPKEFMGLPLGKFVVVETAVPHGVLMNHERKTIEVTETADVQTFTFKNEYQPTIKTVALFEGGTKALEEGMNTVIDRVTLDRLTIGREYTLESKIVDPATEEVLLEGKTYTFVAESFKEEKEIVLEGLFPEAGKTYVVYEKLYRGTELVASHEEKGDKNQTIYVPRIGTRARNKDDDSQYVYTEGKSIVVDRVELENLEEGREYLLVAEAYDQETGEQMMDAEGNRIYGTKVFTYSEVNSEIETESEEEVNSDKKMYVEVEVEVDYDHLKGKILVFFETLYEGSEEIEEKYVIKEDDIENLDQTVYFPSIGTMARDDADGDHMIFHSGKQTIVDAVEYKGLVPGETYVQWLTVYDKETREPLRTTYMKKPVKSFVEFIPDEPNGVVEVPVEIYGETVQGKTLVMMEETMIGTKTVATHFDLEDENQTIRVEIPPEEPPKTGDNESLLPMFLLIASTVCLSFLIAYRKRS